MTVPTSTSVTRTDPPYRRAATGAAGTVRQNGPIDIDDEIDEIDDAIDRDAGDVDLVVRDRAFGRLAVRIGLSVAMLVLLVWQLPDFDPGELLPRFRPSTVAWLAASALTLFAAFALQTLRWDRVLRPMGAQVRFGRLFSLFLAGQFVSNVLPTAFGGDVVRVARLGRDLDDRAVAFASIALERLTGWLVLPLISFVTLALTPAYHDLGAALVTAVVINAVTLAALATLLVTAGLPRWTGAATGATGWRRWIGSVHLGIVAIRRRPRAIVGVVAAGVAFQVTQCASIWMAARALEIPEITFVACLAFFPPTAISQNLPVGFGGLGVREGGFVLFFGALGAASERSIALGLVTYLITLAVSATGAPAFAMARRQVDPAGTGGLVGSGDSP